MFLRVIADRIALQFLGEFDIKFSQKKNLD